MKTAMLVSMLGNVASSTPSSICKNPGQYNATAGFYSNTCAQIVGHYDSSVPDFKARDCDPNKGWDAMRDKSCTGGPDCEIGFAANLIRQAGTRCCNDKWDACSAVAPPKPATVCANPAQYDGKAMLNNQNNETCDDVHEQFLAGSDDFRKRDCTSRAVASVMSHIFRPCCKDQLVVCTAGPSGSGPWLGSGSGSWLGSGSGPWFGSGFGSGSGLSPTSTTSTTSISTTSTGPGPSSSLRTGTRTNTGTIATGSSSGTHPAGSTSMTPSAVDSGIPVVQTAAASLASLLVSMFCTN